MSTARMRTAAPRRQRPPRFRLLDLYPFPVRSSWPEWALLQAHCAYTVKRIRDDLTVAMEAEYQRRVRRARAERRQQRVAKCLDRNVSVGARDGDRMSLNSVMPAAS